MPPKSKYNKKDPISHILDRPDMYVGSVVPKNYDYHIVVNRNFNIAKKSVHIANGLIRIFIEPLSNIMDAFTRSKTTKTPMKRIDITIDKEKGEIRMKNDGEIIAVELHPEEKIYNHSLIFGELLTSSNYDDDEDRLDISGKNGLGVKLTSVFSTSFSVEGVDPVNKKKFFQVWTNNMRNASTPKVVETKLVNGYTEVRFSPDFKRFGIEGFTDDIIALFTKYVVDCAMLTKIDVYLNDELIPIKSLEAYARLYQVRSMSENDSESEIEIDEDDEDENNEDDDTDTEDKPKKQKKIISNSKSLLSIKTADCEIVLMPNTEYETISFANGIYTPLGGTHVDPWAEELFRPIVEKFNKKKGPQLTIKDVKQFFRLFVKASIPKPTFDSQSKLRLEAPTITAKVKKTDIQKILKWEVVSQIEDILKAKEMVVLKKIERKKKGFVKVAKHDAANNAGTSKGRECTLIFVEGDSANTYASNGIGQGVFGKRGRDWFGIYALTGKILNCRNASVSSIAKNKIVCNIIQALGLRYGVDYRDDKEFNTLQYGRVMCITDQDVDGIHISALLQNLFHYLFPTLLQREEPFYTSLQTPIVRVFLSKNQNILFYDENEYRKYVLENKDKKIDKKYYKGLGSSSADDVIETFGKKVVIFEQDEKMNANMSKVFGKKNADMRKVWLTTYDTNNTLLKWNGIEHETLTVSFSDFLNQELIKFSIDDCKRSIPSGIDGLKESHRKSLYTAFKTKLTFNKKKTKKVASFAGEVVNKTEYKHGDQNLHKTIANLASDFVGSNNIPLFFRDGQFGSRQFGGSDCASGRYIFTKLDMFTRYIFREEDDAVLDYIEEDGKSIEPYFYVPILPMILVNGCITGIGTGWSSSIPCYNPLDLIECIHCWMENIEIPEIQPWYKGFTGRIEKISDTKYMSWGNIYEEKGKYVIDELPVRQWIDKFKCSLEELSETKDILKFKNYSDPKTIRFEVWESKDGMNINEKNLKLFKPINLSNMVLFREDQKLQKYRNVKDIISDFCNVRLSYYCKRKKYQLSELEDKIKKLGNKKRFLQEVINGDIVLFREVNGKKTSRKKEELIAILVERKYDQFNEKQKKKDEDEEEENENSEDEEVEITKNGFDYILNMRIQTITTEKINAITKDIENTQNLFDTLQNTKEQDIWKNDLEEFRTVWVLQLNKDEKKTKKAKKANKKQKEE